VYGRQMATPRLEFSAQVSSCWLKFVHDHMIEITTGLLIWQSIVLFKRMLRSQISWGISEPPKSWLNSFLVFIVLFVSVSKNTQVLILPTVISNPRYFLSPPLSPLIRSLGLSLPPTSPTPQYVSPVLISHKYSADLMFDYHWSQ
jgi:hypothetical protein